MQVEEPGSCQGASMVQEDGQRDDKLGLEKRVRLRVQRCHVRLQDLLDESGREYQRRPRVEEFRGDSGPPLKGEEAGVIHSKGHDQIHAQTKGNEQTELCEERPGIRPPPISPGDIGERATHWIPAYSYHVVMKNRLSRPAIGSVSKVPSQVTKVGVHSWAVLGRGEDVLHSYGANQGFILGKRASLVVDTGFHEKVAASILRRVNSKTRRIFVLNTHYHSDHVFGNSVFADTRAVIIANQNCSRSMKVKSEKLLDGYRKRDPKLSRMLRGVKIAYPDITFAREIETQLDDLLEAEITHPAARAHTDGDSMAFVPRDRVLFAGDILWVGYHPNLEDADLQGQIRALKMILRLKPRRIVPGHGPVCGPREVERLIRYLEELDRNIRSGTRKGLTGDEFVRHVIPRWSWDWKMRWLMESSISNLAGKN